MTYGIKFGVESDKLRTLCVKTLEYYKIYEEYTDIQVQFDVIQNATNRIAREGKQDWPSAVTASYGSLDRCGFDICMSAFIIQDWFTNIYRRYFVRQPCKMSGRQDKSRLTFPFYHPKAFTNFRILIVSFSLNISKLFNFLNKNARFMNN